MSRVISPLNKKFLLLYSCYEKIGGTERTDGRVAKLCISVCTCVEGQYANEQNKEIVPIMVEDKFKKSGWLGTLCAGKKYVEFHEPQKFDDNMRQLCDELKKKFLNRTRQGNVRVSSACVFHQSITVMRHVPSVSCIVVDSLSVKATVID